MRPRAAAMGEMVPVSDDPLKAAAERVNPAPRGAVSSGARERKVRGMTKMGSQREEVEKETTVPKDVQRA
ncbi:hypothetical protein Nepgr_017684 [Nepenthes gracilis]|uniref:Uncharacterized protein n=1 Tax=Nepenthes gracilis TaxID=150966 RepID=A0AAD3SPT2_NEPGR|nr:hypothetical protein Nepgr_017684 [Nepenthes gracilis]